VPFREAHALVGALVRRHLDEGRSLAELVAADPALGPEAAALFGPGVSVRRRTSPGAGGPEPVTAQLEAFRRVLVRDDQRVHAS
jgi:argininosuccinate lyase